MWLDILIIVILAGLLVLLLRHWPETKTAVPSQTVNVKKPVGESVRPVRLHPSTHRPTLTARLSGWLTAAAAMFSDRRDGPAPTGVKTAPAGPSASVTAAAAKSAAVEPPSATRDLLDRAEAAQRRGDFAAAERLLVKAAALEPKNPKVYSKLGVVYLEQGDNWLEAEESFRQALKYDPDNGFARNNLGLVLYNQDKFAAAASEYEAAVALDGAVASRHVNLGLAYMALRQYGHAESAFKRASKLEPTNRDYAELVKEAANKRLSHRR